MMDEKESIPNQDVRLTQPDHRVMNTAQAERLLENVDSYFSLEINEPDFEKLWQNRLNRNKQVLDKVGPRYSSIQLLQVNSSATLTPEEKAAVFIQKYIRGFLARKIYAQLLQLKFEQDEEIRHQKQIEQVEEGELLVQNELLKRELEDGLVVMRNADLRFIYAATVIQHAWRKYKNQINCQLPCGSDT